MSIHPYCSSFAGALALIAPPIAFGQTPPADANQAPTAFSENFAAPTTSWKIFPADAAGKDWLQWQPASSGRPGWGFVTQGRMGAMREWAVGTRPFVFDFEIEMDKGKSESWRQNGASVSISSAPLTSPETTDRVLVLAIGVMQSGIQASVKLGPFADFQSSSDSQAPTPDAKVKEAKRYVEAGAAPRGVLGRSGGGGQYQSLEWPGSSLGNSKLRCRIERTADDYIRFTIYHSAGDPSAPVWEGVWQLPAPSPRQPIDMRAIPLRYVNVVTTLDPGVKEGEAPPATAVLAGLITKMTGITAPGKLPEITGYIGLVSDGQEVRILGNDFQNGAVVSLNGAPLATRWVDAKTLEATLKGVLLDKANTLGVVNADQGSNFYPIPLRSGLAVEKVNPAELRRAGGETITLTGHGFLPLTKVTLNGRPAEITFVSSTEIKLKTDAGETGRVKLQVSNGGQNFEVKPLVAYAAHPYLLIQPEDVQKLRARFNAPAMQFYKKMILQLADRSAHPKAMTPKAMTRPDYGEHIWATAWAYLLTGEQKYKDAALRWISGTVGPNDLLASMDPTKAEALRLEHAATGGFTAADPDPSSPGITRQFLPMGQFQIQRGTAVAIAYDLLFEELDPALRGRMIDYMGKHIDLAVPLVKSKDWWYAGNPSNTISVANGAIGLMALSHKEVRDDINELAELTSSTITRMFKSIESDGGAVEGTLYWNYGVGAQINLGIALQNVLGKDYGMLSDPRLEKGLDFAQVAIAGDGNMFVFNDTQPWLGGLVPAALGSSRFQQPLMTWLCDAIMERSSQEDPIIQGGVRPTYTIPAFLLRGDAPPVPVMPPLPTLATLPVTQWGVMRSAPDAFKKGLVVGIKGQGGQTTHHTHGDQGNFVLHAGGEEFFLDAGYGYGQAPLHSLPLIGTKEEIAAFSEKDKVLTGENDAPLLNAWEAGDLRTITVDSTKAYADKAGASSSASKVHRVFAMSGEQALVVLDDVVPAKAGTPVTAQYQAAQTPEIADSSQFLVPGQKTDVRAYLFGPKLDTLNAEPKDLGKRGWVYKHLGRNWNRVSGQYQPNPDQPLVSVFVVAKDKADPGKPTVAYAGDRVEVKLPGGKLVQFAREAGNWATVRPK